MAVEVLDLMEIHQVLVICKDLDGERGSMEVVSPGFQGTDDGEEFPIIDVVILFSRDKQLRKVGVGVPIAIRVSLKEDSTRGIF